MAKNDSAKGNPASKRMSNTSKKNKRINNKVRNEKIAKATNGKAKSLTAFRNLEKEKKNRDHNASVPRDATGRKKPTSR